MKKILILTLGIIAIVMMLEGVGVKEKSVATVIFNTSLVDISPEVADKYVQDILPVIEDIILNDNFFLSEEDKGNLGKLEIIDKEYYNGVYNYNISCNSTRFRIDIYKIGGEFTFCISQRECSRRGDCAALTVSNVNTPDFCVDQVDKDNEKRGMCWAASVATTINFTLNSFVAAEEICKEMKISMDEGATIEEKWEALKIHGLDYRIKYDQLNWEAINKNIYYGKPILVSGFSEKDGHAVTIIDCAETLNCKTITIWNSGSEEITIIPYDDVATTFVTPASNDIFYWSNSLY